MKPYAHLEASLATAFSNNVATCLTRFNNYILFTAIGFIALYKKASGDLQVTKVVWGLLHHRVSHNCLLGKKMTLRLSLKTVHEMLHLPALGPASNRWTGCKQHVTPWKMSDRFSGPIVQAPSRRLISKGEHFCYWNSWMQQKVFLIFLSPAFNVWDVSPTAVCADLGFVTVNVCLSRNKLPLHPDIETCWSHLHLPLQKPLMAQGTSREEDLPRDSPPPRLQPMEAFSWLSLFQEHCCEITQIMPFFFSLWCIKTYFIGQSLLCWRRGQQQSQQRELLMAMGE